eukprot:30506_3
MFVLLLEMVCRDCGMKRCRKWWWAILLSFHPLSSSTADLLGWSCERQLLLSQRGQTIRGGFYRTGFPWCLLHAWRWD